MGSLGKFYRRMLCRHPILVQSVQTGLLMGMGDAMAQKVVEKKCEFDYMRTARFAAFGSLVASGTGFWRDSSAAAANLPHSKKVAVDQLLFAPTFLLIFLVGLKTMEGEDMKTIKKELCAKYKDIVFANWKIWPAVQVCNFNFTPLQYQVLVVQLVALFWNTYLSWKSSQEVDD
ncbi:hypothetical protein NQ315_017110 [Exocentrus adspersus]|uniref:Mitochondrial inner membrane protein Mpv17 n=1 Tax=Exocentrus adspersus TaxID=1586481 RepID=A0AAV8VH63_9CUCU|nr:hypothetical protein NQ315_017110 [Exocentrus adspersus]